MNLELMDKIRQSSLPQTDKAVCQCLAWYAGEEQEAYPSLSTIAQDVSITERAVQLALGRLSKQEVILKISTGGIAGSTRTNHYLIDATRLPIGRMGSTRGERRSPLNHDHPEPRSPLNVVHPERRSPTNDDHPERRSYNIRTIWPKGLAPIRALLADPGDPGYPDQEDPGTPPSAVQSHMALPIAPDTAQIVDSFPAVQVHSALVTQATTVPVQPVPVRSSIPRDQKEPMYLSTQQAVAPILPTDPVQPKQGRQLPSYLPPDSDPHLYDQVYLDLRQLGFEPDHIILTLPQYLAKPGTSLAMAAAHTAELRKLGPERATFHGVFKAAWERLTRGYPYPVEPAVLAQERELYRIKPEPANGRRIGSQRV